MHHPFLDLDFRDTPDFFYKVLKVSQQNFENSWGFYRRPEVGRFQPLHGEWTTSAGAFAEGLQRRFAPEAKTNPF